MPARRALASDDDIQIFALQQFDLDREVLIRR
jgi:hypothetical protein